MYRIRKIIKRIIPVVLIISTISGFVPASASAAVSSRTKSEDALSIATALGIMDSGKQGDEILSLQELANIEARIKRIDENMISQDLSGNASYSDALKVVVTALGYNIVISSSENDEWYKTVVELDLLDGVQESNGNITRENMATMLYNALESPMLVMSFEGGRIKYTKKEDTTLLEDIFDAVKGKGIVTDTPYSTQTTTNANQRNVYIDNVLYIDSECMVPAGYLGYYVDFYAVKNEYDEYKIIWIEKRNFKNEVVTASSEDISDKSTRNQMIYTDPDTNKEKRVDIPEDAVIIYNGMTTGDITDIYPEYGSVTVLDNDSDGKNDCVIIEAYEVMRAEFVDSQNEAIYDYENNITLDLSSVGMYEIFKDGKKGNIATISKNDILLLAPSYYSFGNNISDTNSITIYASNYKIRGTIQKISDEYVYINNEQYRISDDARTDLTVGVYVELELDYFGRVSCFSLTHSTDNYGYVLSYGYDELSSDGSDAVYIRMLTQSGNLKMFKTGDDIIYGGYLANGTYTDKSKISVDTFIALLKNGTAPMDEVVTYTENTDGTLRSIQFADTSRMNTPMIEDEGIFVKNYDKTSVTARSVFVGTNYRVDSGTVIFRVPTGEYSGNPDDYSVYSTNNFEESTFSRVKVYNASDNKVAGVVVLETNDSDEPTEVIGNNVFVIDSIGQSLNDDDETVIWLKGVQAGTYKTISFSKEAMKVGGGKWKTTSRQTSEDLQVGDVIQYGVGEDGYINAYQVLFAPSEQAFGSNKFVARDNNGYLSGLNTIEGRVLDSNGRSILVDGVDFSILTNEGSITVVKDGKVEAGNQASIEIGDYVFVRCNRLYARDIVVYK